MAVASALRDGGGFALAEGSEIRLQRPCDAPRPGLVRSRLAHDRSWRPHIAARARRSPATGGTVAAANDVAAGRHAGRVAGSGGEPFRNPGIGARNPASLI